MAVSRIERWSTGALDVARGSAIFTAATAPLSTAAASVGSTLFLLALLASGQAHRVAIDAFRLPGGQAIVAFLAWVTASSLWNDAGVASGLTDWWAWRKLGYLYLALPLFADERWKDRLVKMLFYLCAVAMAFSYASIVFHVKLRSLPDETLGIVLTNHAIQGAAFAIAAGFGLFLARRATGRVRWLYCLVAVALVVNVLFFGAGRTGYLVVIGVALCGAALSGGWRVSIATAVGLAVLLVSAYYVSPTFNSRMTRGWEELRDARELTTVTSMGIRLVFAQNTVALVRERPWAGYGLGSFKRVYAQYVDSRYTGVQATPAGDPHNQYLYIAFEHGMIGLALFLAMIVILLRTFPRDDYGRLAVCVFFAWCLTSFFSSHFRTFPEGHFYAFVVGILGSTLRTRARG